MVVVVVVVVGGSLMHNLSIKKAASVGVTPFIPHTPPMEKTPSPASIVPVHSIVYITFML